MPILHPQLHAPFGCIDFKHQRGSDWQRQLHGLLGSVCLSRPVYGVPFSHLFTALEISPIESPIELEISTIDLQISTIHLEISPNRLNCRYLQLNWRYLQLNWRYLQIGPIWRYLQLNCRYLQFDRTE